MDVRFGNVRDRHVVLLGYFKIGIDISFRIDDHCYATFLAANKVAGLCQALVIYVLEKHIFIFLINAFFDLLILHFNVQG